jgi:DNA processing protein
MLVETAVDVLDALPMEPADIRPRQTGFGEPAAAFLYDPPPSENPLEDRSALLALLSPEPTMVDDLLRRCHLSPSVTMAVLLELELAGRVETLPGSRVALLPDVVE